MYKIQNDAMTIIPEERLTERAGAALVAAEVEARRLDHSYIGQEHLLLAIVRDEESVGTRVLTALGAPSEKVRAQVGGVIARGNSPSADQIAWTPRARRALDLAVDEARRLNHFYIGTEHLVLGIVHEGQGLGANLLYSLGLSLEKTREGTQRCIAGGPEREPFVRRYNLVVPSDLFQQVQQVADRQDTTVLEVLRRFIRLGLLITELQATPGSALIVRDERGEREILLV